MKISRTNRKRSVAFVLLVLLVFSVTGCAYFNAFYNTRHNFREGERERERSTDPNVQPAGYQKAVESGAKLVEFYPESKYVDDALFIMGQSYYWNKDYFKAKRKFEELMSNYPESPYYTESRLWLGRSLVALKQRQEATSTLRTLMTDTDDGELIGRAKFALAELYFIDSLFVRAEEQFTEVAETSQDQELLGEAHWRAGDAAFRDKRFRVAMEHFREALKHELTRIQRFRVKTWLGRAYYEMRDYDKAASTFQDLLKDKRFYEEHPPVRVELGRTRAAQGRIEDALKIYKHVYENNDRTDHAAHAWYETALIYLKQEGMREETKEALTKARTVKSGSRYALTADSLFNTLVEIEELGLRRQKIQLRSELIEEWLARPVHPNDTVSFTAAEWYDSAAVDSLKLIPLWESAWRDSTIVPVDTTRADTLRSRVDSTGVAVSSDTTDALSDELVTRLDSTLIDTTAEALSPGEVVVDEGDMVLLGDSLLVERSSLPDSVLQRADGLAGDSSVAVQQVAPSTPEELLGALMGDGPIGAPSNAAYRKKEDSPQEPNPDTTTPTPDTTAAEFFDDTSLDEGETADSLQEFAEMPGTGEIPDSLLLASDSLAVQGSDSLVARPETERPDSLAAVADTTGPRIITIFDVTPVQDTLAHHRNELIDIRFQLGEIYLFDLREPDSAQVVFKELSLPPGTDSVRARAWTALAYIAQEDSNYVRRDSMLQVIAEEFRSTSYGRTIAEALGLLNKEEEVRKDRQAFQEAEAMYYSEEGDPQEAYSRYRWVADTYPNSDVAPKALYAAAFIAATDLEDDMTAEEIFTTLQSEYPASEQAITAGKILNDLFTMRNAVEGGDSASVAEIDIDAIPENELENKPDISGGQETLARVLEMRNLLPPEVLSGTGGDVVLRYVVFEDGSASEFRVVKEDPPGRGLAQALIAGLQEVSFNPGKQEGEAVATLVERRYTLPLDAPPNVRPLPKRRGRS
ncbi:tetratricopeptide repeat protein [bacterium]|nr:tetratricopeptide repeat protein [bacterium]